MNSAPVACRLQDVDPGQRSLCGQCGLWSRMEGRVPTLERHAGRCHSFGAYRRCALTLLQHLSAWVHGRGGTLAGWLAGWHPVSHAPCLHLLRSFPCGYRHVGCSCWSSLCCASHYHRSVDEVSCLKSMCAQNPSSLDSITQRHDC